MLDDTHQSQEVCPLGMVLEVEQGNNSPDTLVLGVGDLVGPGLLVLLEGHGVLGVEVAVHGLVAQGLAPFLSSSHLLAAMIASGLMRGPLFQGEVIPQLALTHVETRLAEAESGCLR